MRPSPTPVPDIEIAAEAAAWISRLHGPHRTPQMERECLEWQARSEAHRLAFERCTATWDDVRGLSLSDAYAGLPASSDASNTSNASKASDASGLPGLSGAPPASASASASVASTDLLAAAAQRRAASSRMSRRVALLATAAAVVIGAGILLSMPPDISTSIGERRVVVLDDGSRVTLNTETRIAIDYSPTRRTVELEHGEALFEVAKDAARPFSVRVARGEVVAVGTVFSVRRTEEALAVTLIEGEIAVKPPSARAATAPQKLLVRPGERLNVDLRRPSTPAKVDHPRIEQVTAWKRGEASFDDVPLDEAVAEMNRYSRVRIVLSDSALATRRVSGVFHTGDNLAFARAVAALHGLSVDEQPEKLQLTQR